MFTNIRHPLHRLAIAIILAGVGLYIFINGLTYLHGYLQSKDWPHVGGRIIRYTVEPSGASVKNPKFAISVHYSYNVQGIQYMGRDFSHSSSKIGSVHPSEKDAIHEYEQDEQLQKWQVGKKVEVYFDPQDPSVSVLKTGVTAPGWRMCLFAIVSILYSLWEFRRLNRFKKSGTT